MDDCHDSGSGSHGYFDTQHAGPAWPGLAPYHGPDPDHGPALPFALRFPASPSPRAQDAFLLDQALTPSFVLSDWDHELFHSQPCAPHLPLVAPGAIQRVPCAFQPRRLHAVAPSGPGHVKDDADGCDGSPGVASAERSVEDQIRDFCGLTNYRRLRPRIEVHHLTPSEDVLARQSRQRQTRRFPRLFANATAANDALAGFQTMCRKPSAECTTPIEDPTFPATDDAAVAVVRDVFEAISDWDYILEWKSALSREARDRVVKHMLASSAAAEDPSSPPHDVESLRPSPAELDKVMPSVDVQQKRILGQIPSDQTIEWISWGIVQAAVTSQQGITQLPCWCEADGG